MGDFDDQLRRLKECLGLHEDQDVARALGMSKAAFSNRKRSRSFPDERVVGLKATWPGLDVAYIFSGERSDGFLNSAFAEAALTGDREFQRTVTASARRQAVAKPISQPSQVVALLESVEWCDDVSLDLLVRLASHLASRSGGKTIPRQEIATALQALGSRSRKLPSKVVLVDESHASKPRRPTSVALSAIAPSVGILATPNEGTRASRQPTKPAKAARKPQRM